MRFFLLHFFLMVYNLIERRLALEVIPEEVRTFYEG